MNGWYFVTAWISPTAVIPIGEENGYEGRNGFSLAAAVAIAVSKLCFPLGVNVEERNNGGKVIYAWLFKNGKRAS